MRRPILRTLFAVLLGVALLTPAALSQPKPGKPHRPTIRYFIATAYSVEGTGASGKWSRPGTVAADRDILPLNSRIRIYGAGKYSGEYTVEDTGGKVDGHHIDVYMPTKAEAKKFGRQRVKVVILKYGDDEAKSARSAAKGRSEGRKPERARQSENRAGEMIPSQLMKMRRVRVASGHEHVDGALIALAFPVDGNLPRDPL